MYAIKLSARIGQDRRLVITLPDNAPTGDVELTIRQVVPTSTSANLPYEEIRAKLSAARALSTVHRAPEGTKPLTVEERLKIGQLPPHARPSEDLIAEDRA